MGHQRMGTSSLSHIRLSRPQLERAYAADQPAICRLPHLNHALFRPYRSPDISTPVTSSVLRHPWSSAEPSRRANQGAQLNMPIPVPRLAKRFPRSIAMRAAGLRRPTNAPPLGSRTSLRFSSSIFLILTLFFLHQPTRQKQDQEQVSIITIITIIITIIITTQFYWPEGPNHHQLTDNSSPRHPQLPAKQNSFHTELPYHLTHNQP